MQKVVRLIDVQTQAVNFLHLWQNQTPRGKGLVDVSHFALVCAEWNEAEQEPRAKEILTQESTKRSDVGDADANEKFSYHTIYRTV